jgi:hypothetical protein
MPAQLDLVKIILPALIRLCPELVAGTVTRGKIVTLLQIEPENQAEAIRKLSRKLKVKPRENFNDETHVIKVSEAIKCIEKTNDKQKTFFLSMAQWAAKNMIGLGGGDLDLGPMQTFMDATGACIRENCLRSDTIRNVDRQTKHGRPAKGHGKGRT